MSRVVDSFLPAEDVRLDVLQYRFPGVPFTTAWLKIGTERSTEGYFFRSIGGIDHRLFAELKRDSIKVAKAERARLSAGEAETAPTTAVSRSKFNGLPFTPPNTPPGIHYDKNRANQASSPLAYSPGRSMVKPMSGRLYVEIQCPDQNSCDHTLALLDTRAKGGASRNLILKKYADSIGITYSPFSQRAADELGLSGRIRVVGHIRELKFYPMPWNDGHDRPEKDIAEYLEFFVYDGEALFGDLLLSRDFVKSKPALMKRSHILNDFEQEGAGSDVANKTTATRQKDIAKKQPNISATRAPAPAPNHLW